MKKTILAVISALILLSGTALAQPADLQAQQQKVNNIKKTQQGQEILRLVDKYSAQYKVDSKLAKAVILVESGFNPKATSSCGAKGLFQMMDNTFYGRKVGNNPYNIEHNVHAGVKHLAGLSAKYSSNQYMVLAAYNAGGGNVDRSLKQNGRIPSYTRGYVNKVLGYKQYITF